MSTAGDGAPSRDRAKARDRGMAAIALWLVTLAACAAVVVAIGANRFLEADTLPWITDTRGGSVPLVLLGLVLGTTGMLLLSPLRLRR